MSLSSHTIRISTGYIVHVDTLKSDLMVHECSAAVSAEQPIDRNPRIGLAVNMTAARALGIQFPPTILAFAEEVFE